MWIFSGIKRLKDGDSRYMGDCSKGPLFIYCQGGIWQDDYIFDISIMTRRLLDMNYFSIMLLRLVV